MSGRVRAPAPGLLDQSSNPRSTASFGVIGTCVIDNVLILAGAPPGVSQATGELVSLVADVHRGLGGKGFLTVNCLALLGVPSLFAVPDERDTLRDMWPMHVAQPLKSDSLSALPESWIAVEPGKRPYVFFKRAVWQIMDAHAQLVSKVVQRSTRLYVTYEEPQVLRQISSSMKSGSLKIPDQIAFNPAAPLLARLPHEAPGVLEWLLGRASVLLMNAGEEKLLFEVLQVASWHEIPAAAGAEVVVTLGPGGARFRAAGAPEWRKVQRTAAVASICPVGAGDAFSGAYLAARWELAKGPLEACEIAVAVAGAQVEEAVTAISHAALARALRYRL